MDKRKASSRKAHAALLAGTLAMGLAPIVHAATPSGASSGSAADSGADSWQILAPANTDLPINKSIPPSAGSSVPAPATNVAPAPAPSSSDTAVIGQPIGSTGGFTLEAGRSLQIQLAGWAKSVGWSVVWNVPDDWIVPGNGVYPGDFPSAVGQVVEALASNGADVRADIWTGNQTVVIHQNGAAQ